MSEANSEPVAYTADRFDECAALMAAAFDNDAGFRFVSEDAEERQKVARWSLGISLSYAAKHGKAFILGNPAEAIAVWLAPGAYPLSLMELLKAGALKGLLHFRIATLRRLIAIAEHPDRIHAQTLHGPHWYLMTLAVHPLKQGKGFGTRLLEHGLRLVDKESQVCGLDTANPAAIPLYQKLGFAIARSDEVPNGGPPIWLMVRPQKPGPVPTEGDYSRGCTMFVNTRLSIDTFANIVAQSVQAPVGRCHHITCDWGTIDVDDNDEYSFWKTRRPDSFLFYRYRVDVMPKEGINSFDAYVSGTRSLLRYLRDLGMDAVPACNFEDELNR